jgi:hypothetical protein
VGQENLKTFINNYYKNLFGTLAPCFVSLREKVTQDIPQLSEEERIILTSPIIKRRCLKPFLGPYGFPVEFYQRFCPVIKNDLMAIVVEHMDICHCINSILV